MEAVRVIPEQYRRTVLAYQGLPTVAAIVFAGVFVAVYLFSQSYLLAFPVAAIPAAFLIWRWVMAGRQLDRWGCPRCGRAFPKRSYWSYPPKRCPLCGEQ